MKGRLGVAVMLASLVSAGSLLAQAQSNPPAKPAAKAPSPMTHGQPQAQATSQAPAKIANATAAAPRWTSDQIKEAQEGLKRAKVFNGPVNGVLGLQTRRAIRAFQREHKLTVTGELSDSLLTMLKETK